MYTLREPERLTDEIIELQHRADVDDQFGAVVDDIREIMITHLVPPEQLIKAARLVLYEHSWRTYKFYQGAPDCAPGERPGDQSGWEDDE